MGDGIGGMVAQPLEGAQKEGFAGFLKGFGKGVGGLMLKPAAGTLHIHLHQILLTLIAIWGIPAYTAKGVWAEMKKHMGANVQSYILASRIAQGYDEVKRATPEERSDVVQRWNQLQQEPRKKNWWQKKDPSIDQAIKDSVAATSTGDAEQDAHIQRAIEASIDQLQQASIEGTDDEALERAIKASMDEMSKAHSDEDIEEQMARAVQKSLRDSRRDDSDDDENIKEALRRSQTDNKRNADNDEERVVMEYVKKQSLLEQEHKQNLGASSS